MKRFLVLTSILVASLIAGCGGGVKTYVDTEKPISVGIEDEFIIALDANPTTGYDWEVSCDWYKLHLVEEKYTPDEKAARLVRAGGTQYFRFQASKTGKTDITFVYKRPWEEPTPQDVTKVFKVEIKGGLFVK